MLVEFNLDVLKPHQPGNFILARALKNVEGVSYVMIKVDEIDQQTTSIYIRIRGSEKLNIDAVIECLDKNNCSLHSVDEVIISDDN